MRLSVFFFCFFFCVFLIRFPSHSMNSGILSGTFHLLRFKLMQAGTQFAMESCLRLGFAREWGLVSLWDPIDQSRRLFARRTLWGRSFLLLCTGSVLLWRGEKCWDSAPNDLGSSLLEMQQQISQSWPETEDFQLGQPSSVPDQSNSKMWRGGIVYSANNAAWRGNHCMKNSQSRLVLKSVRNSL